MFSLQKRCLAGSLHNRYFNYKEKIINIRFTDTKNPAPLFIKMPVCHPPLRTTKKQPEIFRLFLCSAWQYARLKTCGTCPAQLEAHSARAARHSAVPAATAFFGFGKFRNHSFRRNQQAGNRSRILQRRSDHFGRVNDTGFNHIGIFVGRRIITVVIIRTFQQQQPRQRRHFRQSDG